MHTAWIVPWIVPAHVVAGGLALVFGYIALYAAKGAPRCTARAGSCSSTRCSRCRSRAR
jgi:hypothetical protein